MFKSECKCNISAIRKAEQMRLCNPVSGQKIIQIVSKPFNRKFTVAARRPAVSSRVKRYHAIPVTEIVSLMNKISMILSVTVQKDQWKTGTAFFVIQLRIHMMLLSVKESKSIAAKTGGPQRNRPSK